nr:uncharacterized protein LOC124809953 isoform X3 [Hydra vulgaris]
MLILNLLRYTGYYKFNIDTVMEGFEKEIFICMGYRLDEENDQFLLQLSSNHSTLVELAYQLYLSQVYCANVCAVFKKLFELTSVDEAKIYFINHSNDPNVFQKYLNSSFENHLISKKEQQYIGQIKYDENNKSQPHQISQFKTRTTTV